MSQPARSGVITLDDARKRIPGPAGEHAISQVQRGTLNALLALRPPVRPTPLSRHAQDEVYVVIRGRGILFHDGRRDRFDAGDLMYVAAGVEHCFEDFTEDLTIWVVFYGPPGGELPEASL